MKSLTTFCLIAAALAVSACNTWQGAKQDAREVGGTVTHAVGTGMEKAGEGVEKAGAKVKGAAQ